LGFRLGAFATLFLWLLKNHLTSCPAFQLGLFAPRDSQLVQKKEGLIPSSFQGMICFALFIYSLATRNVAKIF